MSQWLTLAYYEIKRTLRVKFLYVVQIIIPLVIIFILGSALSGVYQEHVERPPSEAAVAVWNQELTGSALDGAVEQFLEGVDQQPYIRLSRVASREEMVALLRAGEADLGVIIPDSFSESVRSGSEAEWMMIPGKREINALLAQTIMQSFLDEVNTWQSIYLTLGGSAVESIRAVWTDRDVAGTSYIRSEAIGGGHPPVTALQYYGAHMLVMFLFYGGMSAAISLVNEREDRTLARLQSLPIRPWVIVYGKISAQFVIALMQAAIIIGFSKLVYGLDWGNQYGKLVLLIGLTVFSAMSLAVLISMLVSSEKATALTFQLLIIVMSSLGGAFIILSNKMLEFLGAFTIHYWSASAIIGLMNGSGGEEFIQAVWALTAFCAVLAAAVILVYRRVGYRE
ncbi:ABC transporter permease [Paenibacillus turpanensis]|uniref:ABC transporter permease n=1 Tax=Paenibacillus turpanensis TaxID=2689078 RepID=UPI00140C3BC8|nr:ABC transporter permease [Paenibacillus turpanensis]